jgi:hypothetical protein
MAKIHLDRMRQKYGFTGERYRELMQKIIGQNSVNIANNLGRMTKENYERAAKKVTTREKRFIVPDVSEALPKRGVFARKAAIDGKRITDKLRDQMTKDLRTTLTQFTPNTGEATYLFRRGAKAGRVNPKLVADFESRIQKTFEGYTRRDPSYNMPRNVHSIAVTEVRSVADEIKYAYMEQIKRRNPDFQIRKKWIHNKALSEEPRPHHMALDGKTVGWDEFFIVDSPDSGRVQMRYPHDPGAPAGEVINCHCDFDVIVQRLT